jgi:protein phosphatase
MAEVKQSFGFPLSVNYQTDVGCVRTNNEDSAGFNWLEDSSLFVIVADGMGGHEAGEVASSLAVRVVEEAVAREVDGDPRERIYAALLEANEAILDEGSRSGTGGMGTTAIISLIKGNQCYFGLIGDSRCYHFRSGHMIWRTSDHTRVQMLIEQGKISDEEARTHPEAGMLTRALGHSRMADGRPLVPDVLEHALELESDDTLVLCSDGLHDLVDDWEIGRAIAGLNCEAAAAALVELACERGGHDNVTVAVINAGVQAGEYDPDFEPEPWNSRFLSAGLDDEENITFDEPQDETIETVYPGSGLEGDENYAKAAPVLADTGVVMRRTFGDAPGMPETQVKKSKMGLMVGVGAVVVLLVVLGLLLLGAGGFAVWYFGLLG